MKNKVKVYVEGIGEVTTEEGNSLENLSKEIYGNGYRRYLGARINNTIYHLKKNVEENMSIKYLYLKDEDGYKIYTRTISAVLIMACKEIFPQCKIKIEHFIGEGLYAELEGGKSISFSEIEKIKKKMEDIIQEDIPIIREKVVKKEGINLFKGQGYEDKVRLYNTLDYELIQIYRIGDHVDGFHGYLAPSTGYVNIFDLKYYYPGAIVLFPTTDSIDKLPEFREQKKLAKVFKEANEWASILDLGYLGSLNEKVLNGDIDEVIRISEALHEKKIGHIADEICKDDDINIILIAGPPLQERLHLLKG